MAPDRFLVEPAARVGGSLAVPGDKSISHRAVMLGAIAEGTTHVRGFLRGEDCLATLAAFRAMGVPITEQEGGALAIEGVGLHGLAPPPQVLDLGNSGTAMRLMAGLLAGQRFDSELTGDASLRRRPMERVAAPLRLMGAAVETQDGKPPLRIGGGRRLAGIDYALPVASAQVKSALLLAGLYAEGATVVRLPGITRDHTELMLGAMGADVLAGHDVVRLRPGRGLRALALDVPGDFSSAAFFLVAGALAAEDGLLLRNVGVNATRTGLLSILRAMGAAIETRNLRTSGLEQVADLYIRKSALHGIDVPRDLVPLAIDEFPVLFVAAAGASGTTTVRGAEELRTKESDRIAVMAAGLRALGATVEELPDGLVIQGGRLAGGTIDSRNDHRIAMAFAVASLIADGPIEILRTAEVATSFPGFVETAAGAGLRISAG